MKEQRQKNWFSIIKDNKYLLTLFVALIWMTFFDQNSFVKNYRLTNKYEQYLEQKETYIQEIKDIDAEMDRLENDPKYLEKLAREKYLMKKKDEEIFLIMRNDNDDKE